MTTDDMLYGLVEAFSEWLASNEDKLDIYLSDSRIFHFDLRVMVNPKKKDLQIYDNGTAWGVL
jgi:hypothetical protein